MNRAELAAQVADAAGLSKSDADSAVAATLDAIKGSLAGGDSVTLIGFGTFSVSQREARTGRNPSTGAKINIPAKKVAKFSAGKALKDAVA
jgi:DNA-binding protein HU-beta